MDIETAAAICHLPHRFARRDDTLDLADELIGAKRRQVADEERRALTNETIAAAHAKGYGVAAYELLGLAQNFRAFSRGMISAEVLPGYFAQARKLLDEMERAVSGAQP